MAQNWRLGSRVPLPFRFICFNYTQISLGKVWIHPLFPPTMGLVEIVTVKTKKIIISKKKFWNLVIFYSLKWPVKTLNMKNNQIFFFFMPLQFLKAYFSQPFNTILFLMLPNRHEKITQTLIKLSPLHLLEILHSFKISSPMP